MKTDRCQVCGYIDDSEKGVPEGDKTLRTKFDDHIYNIIGPILSGEQPETEQNSIKEKVLPRSKK
ncbi:MAG: rubredoxin [Thermodesulfobacteriota bacterium]|nr:rubredoxin [Thermodesulfobacteriota bacterium]